MQYIEMENEMARYFHAYQQSQVKEGKYRQDTKLSIWLSPAYWLSEDGLKGGMSCDTYTYHIYQESQTGKFFCELQMKRAEARFAHSDAGVAMTEFEWYTIQEMVPWLYGGCNPFDTLAPYMPLPPKRKKDANEYLRLRNLLNLFFERRLHQADELFADGSDTMLTIESLGLNQITGKYNIRKALRKCIEKETENHHGYSFLGITGMPVIELAEDGQNADAVCAVEVFQAELWDEDMGNWKLKRQMGVASIRFCKGDSWKIQRLEIHNMISLPDVQYRNDRRYDKMGHTLDSWELDQPLSGLISSEDCMEIENIINGWVYASRRGELPKFVNAYMKNPEQENRMHMKSYGKDSQIQNSYEEILEKVEEMNTHYQNRFYTYHAPTTPVITMNEKGDRARGTWFDHASTNLGSMGDLSKRIPYMTFLNKYVHDFRKIGGKWYFTGFSYEPLIALPDWELDMAQSKGYVTNSTDGRFPDIFELAGGED